MEKENKKDDPKWSGFFIAAWFLVIGIILFYTPIYIGINGFIENVINIFGWLAIIVSFLGAFIELSEIFKNDGFSYIGVSLVFLIPAILLHFLQEQYLSNHIAIKSAKAGVVLFVIIGTGFVLYGISFLLEKSSNKTNETVVVTKEENKKSVIELIAPIIIAILSLTTAIIKFISYAS